MRPRTPSILWIPFVFSIGTISWGLLVAGLVLLSLVVITPAVADLRAAEAQRNDYQATLELLDQKIALQKEFVSAATQDRLLMERLASRQLNLNRNDQEVLPLDPDSHFRDRTVDTLLAGSLVEVKPVAVKPMPWFLEATQAPGVRPFLIMLACGALTLSFFLSVRFERR